MAKLKTDIRIGFTGLKQLVHQLEELCIATPRILEETVYEGGGIVADEMKRQLKQIPVIPDFVYKGKDNKLVRGATQEQLYGKNGLIESMGTAPIQHYHDWLNTKIGFDGYNSVKTKKYPNGQPNMMIARSINAGTSFRQRIPFVEETAKRAKGPAMDAMRIRLEREISHFVD